MKRSRIVGAAIATASLLILGGYRLAPVHAENTPNAQAGYQGIRIAVIDVGKVFKEYAKYKSLAENLKAEIETKEQELRSMEQVMRGKVESMKSITKPADRDTVEKDVADMRFNFEKKKQSYRGELMQREADMYSTVYKELTDLLKAYCQENGIHVVLRLQEEANDPQAVMHMLNRQVVYSHQNLDLTDVIIQGMNQRVKAGQ